MNTQEAPSPGAPANAPTPRRRGCLLKLLAACVTSLVLLVVLDRAVTGDWDRVDIVVTNSSQQPAVVALAEDWSLVLPETGVALVKPGATGRASYHTGRTIGSTVLRVQVGPDALYEGSAGVLVDDDGPHRFTVSVSDGGVTAVRRSNEGPHELRMARVTLGRPAAE